MLNSNNIISVSNKLKTQLTRQGKLSASNNLLYTQTLTIYRQSASSELNSASTSLTLNNKNQVGKFVCNNLLEYTGTLFEKILKTILCIGSNKIKTKSPLNVYNRQDLARPTAGCLGVFYGAM